MSKVGRPPRGGIASEEVVRARITSSERMRFDQLAERWGGTLSGLLRAWIEAGALPGKHRGKTGDEPSASPSNSVDPNPIRLPCPEESSLWLQNPRRVAP